MSPCESVIRMEKSIKWSLKDIINAHTHKMEHGINAKERWKMNGHPSHVFV